MQQPRSAEPSAKHKHKSQRHFISVFFLTAKAVGKASGCRGLSQCSGIWVRVNWVQTCHCFQRSPTLLCVLRRDPASLSLSSRNTPGTLQWHLPLLVLDGCRHTTASNYQIWLLLQVFIIQTEMISLMVCFAKYLLECKSWCAKNGKNAGGRLA